MKTTIVYLFSITLLHGTMAFAPARAAEEKAKQAVETPRQRAVRMQWWREARFGMFIHWGIYAVPADGEWYMTNHHVPISEYEKYRHEIQPGEVRCRTVGPDRARCGHEIPGDHGEAPRRVLHVQDQHHQIQHRRSDALAPGSARRVQHGVQAAWRAILLLLFDHGLAYTLPDGRQAR